MNITAIDQVKVGTIRIHLEGAPEPRPYPAIYSAQAQGTSGGVTITDATNNSTYTISDVSTFRLNGATYPNVVELVEALNGLIGNFRKPSSGGGGGGDELDPVFTAWRMSAIDPDTGKFVPSLLPPSGSGSTDEHTDIKSSDEPTITTPDPTNPGQMRTEVIATREWVEAILPPVSAATRTDVTALFTTSVPVEDFHVELVDFGGTRRPMIRMWGQDTSGSSNILVVTAPAGFGSWYNNTGNNALTMHGKLSTAEDGSRSVSHYPVDITPETDSQQTTITFAAEIGHFDVSYFVGVNPDNKTSSYWTDINGLSHPFTYANTPVSGLSGLGNTLMIAGAIVPKTEVREIVFGSDYAGETALPEYFLRALPVVRRIDASILTSVTQVQQGAFGESPQLEEIVYPVFASGATLGDYFTGQGFDDPTALKRIDISGFGGVTNIGVWFFARNAGLNEIQIGGVNWSSKSVGNLAFDVVANSTSSILRADTSALANAFKSKFPRLSNWSVILNS